MRIIAALLTIFAVVWIASILPSEIVRLKHRALLNPLNNQQELSAIKVQSAIDDYITVAAYNFCHGDFHIDLTRLLMLRFAQQEPAGDFEQNETTLSRAIAAIKNHLRCQPNDGNGWLIKAIIEVQHAGFNSAALDAYKQSSTVTPREAWLAERRILFILNFLPILDAQAKSILVNDIKVMQNSSTNRQRAFRKSLGIESIEQLLLTIKGASQTTEQGTLPSW